MSNEEFIESIGLEGEEWRNVVGFEGFYMISSFGRIVALERMSYNGFKDVYRKQHLMKPNHSSETPSVILSKDSGSYKKHIAKLVADTFLPSPPSGYSVLGYKDNNKLNCCVANLEWRLPKERHAKFFIYSISGEKWKPIDDTGYAVSTLGRIKSLKRNVKFSNRTVIIQEKIIKPFLGGGGYYYVNLGRENRVSVHRIVAKAFIPNPNNFTDVDHINAIRTDNRVENLHWVTKSMNMRNPLTVRKLSIATKNNPSKSRCVPVVCLLDGEPLKEYESIASASRDGFERTCIHDCLSGKSNTHKGYQWMYLSDYKTLVNKSKNT